MVLIFSGNITSSPDDFNNFQFVGFEIIPSEPQYYKNKRNEITNKRESLKQTTKLCNAEDDKVEKYSCSSCDYQASHVRTVKQHEREVHLGIRYACRLCDYQATRSTNLTRHYEKTHKCYNENKIIGI